MSRNRLSAMRNLHLMAKNRQNVDTELETDEKVRKDFQKSNYKIFGIFLMFFIGGVYFFFKEPSVNETIQAKK
jgi:hypothetical protein